MSRAHHYRGIGQYAEQLMDLAEGRPVFAGRGQKPSNKEVLAAIAAISKCRQGSFFTSSAGKPCTCGWHTKAAARKRARQAQSDASASSTPTVAVSPNAPPTSEPSCTHLARAPLLSTLLPPLSPVSPPHPLPLLPHQLLPASLHPPVAQHLR